MRVATHRRRLSLTVALVACAAAFDAGAKVPAAKAAELDGPQLTCMGAERAGSADGVAAFTGKYLGKWPGVRSAFGYEPGPYAAEKPLLVITTQSAAQHAQRLTAGQQEMLRKFGQSYRIAVYQIGRAQV